MSISSRQWQKRLLKMEKRAKNVTKFGSSKIQVDPPKPMKKNQFRGRR